MEKTTDPVTTTLLDVQVRTMDVGVQVLGYGRGCPGAVP